MYLFISYQCLTITLPFVAGDAQVLGGCVLSWVSTDVNPNYGTITGSAECFNTGGEPWGTAGTHAGFTQDTLVTRRKK